MLFQKKAKKKQYFAAAFLIIQVVILFALSLPFLTGISLGIVFYVILEPLYKKFVPILKNKSLTAVSLMLLSFFILVLPLAYAGYVGMLQLVTALQSEEVLSFFETFPFPIETLEIKDFLQTHLSTIINYLQAFSFSALGSTAFILLNAFIMYFILFFLFLRGPYVHKFLLQIIPFHRDNAEKLLEEERKLIQSTIVSNTAVALSLGLLFAAGLFVIGYQDFLFWFFLSVILSFIPVVGIQFIWIPIGIYLILKQNYSAGIGIIVWGGFLSFILDTYIRQLAQNWFGKIDPFISIAGITIGIFYFGIAGIVVGPFLVSLLVESFKIYLEEYGNIYK